MEILAAILLGSAALAGEPAPLDAASAEALSKTQEVLRDPGARAGQVDRGLESMVGNDTAKKEEVYDLAAEVFQDLVKRSGGDPLKMSEILEKAQKDPAAFGKTLSPAQLERIKQLARELEGAGPAPH